MVQPLVGYGMTKKVFHTKFHIDIIGQQTNNCSTGFTTSSLHGHKAKNERQYIFPWINFTCHGNITVWNFYARSNTNQRSILYPEFQVWRVNGSLYTKVAQTSMSDSDQMLGRLRGSTLPSFQHNVDDLYMYNISDSGPMSFEPGDVVGVHTPRGNGNPQSRLRLRFNQQQNDGPLSYFISDNLPLSMLELPGSEFTSTTVDIPLISAQVVIFETTSKLLLL